MSTKILKTTWAWLKSPQASRLEIAAAQAILVAIYEAVKHA